MNDKIDVAPVTAETFYMQEGQIAEAEYRFYAYLWDIPYFVRDLFPFIVVLLISLLFVSADAIMGGFIVFVSIFYFFWSVGYIYYQEATPGKKRYGLKVKTENKERLHFIQILGREWAGKYLSRVCVIGYLICLVRRDRKTLHDLLNRTNVYYMTSTVDISKSSSPLVPRVLAQFLLVTAILGFAINLQENHPDNAVYRLIAKFLLR